MSDARHGDRAVILANYILMFLATFTFGLFSLVAVFLAYARRGRTGGIERSHYDFQIRSFWHDVGLIIIGAIAGFLALASGVGALVGLGGITLPFGITFALAGWMTIGLAILWGLLWIYGFINLIIDSVRGMLRLASGRSMDKTRPL